MSKQTKTDQAPVSPPTGPVDEPKAKRNPPRKPDLFSIAKRIAKSLETFPVDEQIQTLGFVQGILQSKQRAASLPTPHGHPVQEA